MKYKEPKYFDQMRDGMFFPGFLAAIAASQYVRKTIGRFMHIPFVVEDNIIVYYYHWKEIHEYSEWLFKKFKNNPKFKVEINQKWTTAKKIVDRIWDEIEKINLAKISDKELSNLFSDYLNNFYIAFSYACISDCFSIHSEQVIVKELAKLTKKRGELKRLSEFLNQSTEPSWLAFMQKEKNDLVLIMNKIIADEGLNNLFKKDIKIIIKEIKQYKTIYNLLEKHQTKYFWIQNGYSDNVRLGMDYFLKRIKEHLLENNSKKFEITVKDKKTILTKKKRLFKKLGLSNNVQLWIELADMTGEMQDIRKARQMKSYYYFDLLLKEIGKRKGYSLYEMKYLAPEEVQDLFEGKLLSHQKIQLRFKGLAINMEEETYEIKVGRKYKEFSNKLKSNSSKSRINDFSGLSVSTGKIAGKVKIIMKSDQFKNFQEGDILITSMTTPDFMPIMKRAAAIVTNEGGLTCHAAIIARELDIPCIVGTRVATKVLEDGMLIEVNANHGVVKIIK